MEKLLGLCIANYDVQLSYIRFLIKEGYKKIGEKLLEEIEKRLRKGERQLCSLYLTKENHAQVNLCRGVLAQKDNADA